MQVFIVTSKSEEKNISGVILSVKTRCFGIYTNETMASAIATKIGGSVLSFYLDQEKTGDVLQYWENPGYVSRT